MLEGTWLLVALKPAAERSSSRTDYRCQRSVLHLTAKARRPGPGNRRPKIDRRTILVESEAGEHGRTVIQIAPSQTMPLSAMANETSVSRGEWSDNVQHNFTLAQEAG